SHERRHTGRRHRPQKLSSRRRFSVRIVILSEAKDLARWQGRFFAALRVTNMGGSGSNMVHAQLPQRIIWNSGSINTAHSKSSTPCRVGGECSSSIAVARSSDVGGRDNANLYNHSMIAAESRPSKRFSMCNAPRLSV